MPANPNPTTNTPPAPQTRDDRTEVLDMARRGGLPDDFANGLMQRGLTFNEARGAITAEMARLDRAAGGHLNVRAVNGPTVDPLEQMTGALVARMGGPAADAGNQYRHARLADMARDVLELRGIRTTGMAPAALIERALHTTSDFPELLQGAGQRTLLRGYASYPGGLKRICRASTARDFRAKQSLQLGEWPELLKINDSGEYKAGTMAEAKNSYQLFTYGRIFGLTRQAMLNDDLDSMADMAVKIGRAAAEVEAKVLVGLLASNPVMNDAKALFHVDHGNLGTGAGSVLGLAGLTAARKAMRLQTGQDGKTPIDATASFLVVPAALETTAEQLIATLQPTTVAEVNPFGGKLELVVDPRLDAFSATAWYLASNPSTLDTIEYAYLESEVGPQVLVQAGFEVDGVRMKGRLDFGAGVLDWRGLYKANGA